MVRAFSMTTVNRWEFRSKFSTEVRVPVIRRQFYFRSVLWWHRRGLCCSFKIGYSFSWVVSLSTTFIGILKVGIWWSLSHHVRCGLNRVRSRNLLRDIVALIKFWQICFICLCRYEWWCSSFCWQIFWCVIIISISFVRKVFGRGLSFVVFDVKNLTVIYKLWTLLRCCLGGFAIPVLQLSSFIAVVMCCLFISTRVPCNINTRLPLTLCQVFISNAANTVYHCLTKVGDRHKEKILT